MVRKGRCLCPACGKNLAPKTIHAHTSECALWKAQYGDPFPYFKFSGTPSQYTAEAKEGVDYVVCRECLRYGWDFRFKRMMDHLKGVHGLDEASYLERFPGAPVRLASTLEARKSTVRERFGVDNVFQAEGVKARSKVSMLERHGVTSPIQSPSIRAQIERTNQERYGAVNAFASPVVQERIRSTNTERYGVENPNQSPMVMVRRVATNQDRYGADHFVETEAFAEKFKATSQERYGADHPMQSPEGIARWEAGCIEKIGERNPLLVREIYDKSYASSVANHGGIHHLSDPAVIEARKKHLMEKYGVDNISKVPEIKERIITRLKERFRDGAIPVMTTPERVFKGLVPDRVVYSGDFSYWVAWANGRRKNPDFVVLTEEQYAAYKAGVPLNDLRTHLVVEINGTFWHTTHKSMTREARNREFIDGYASVGVTCLVIWEDELTVSDSLCDRIAAYLEPPKIP